MALDLNLMIQKKSSTNIYFFLSRKNIFELKKYFFENRKNSKIFIENQSKNFRKSWKNLDFFEIFSIFFNFFWTFLYWFSMKIFEIFRFSKNIFSVRKYFFDFFLIRKNKYFLMILFYHQIQIKCHETTNSQLITPSAKIWKLRSQKIWSEIRDMAPHLRSCNDILNTK